MTIIPEVGKKYIIKGEYLGSWEGKIVRVISIDDNSFNIEKLEGIMSTNISINSQVYMAMQEYKEEFSYPIY